MPSMSKRQYAFSGSSEHRENRWWVGVGRQVAASVKRLEEKGFFRDEAPKRRKITYGKREASGGAGAVGESSAEAGGAP